MKTGYVYYFRMIAFIILVSSSFHVLAQEKDSIYSISLKNDSILKLHKDKSYFSVGLNYVSDVVYLGRKDSLRVPYLTPTLGYYNKSGIYAEVGLGFLTSSSQSRLDLFSITAGYSFNIGKYSGDISASKYFYNSQSTNVRSEQKGSIDYESYFDGSIITPTFSSGLSFASKTDIYASLGLEHQFELLPKKLNITLGADMFGSTQNYYNEYFRSRRFGARRKGPILPNVKSISGEVVNASDFKILDYEIRMPLEYQLGKLKITATPYYIIPVNPSQLKITTVLTNGSSVVKSKAEKIENTFYCSFDIVLEF